MGSSSVGSTLCGVLISEGLSLLGGSSPGVFFEPGNCILGNLSRIFFTAYGIPAASGTASSPRYARSWDEDGLALEMVFVGEFG